MRRARRRAGTGPPPRASAAAAFFRVSSRSSNSATGACYPAAGSAWNSSPVIRVAAAGDIHAGGPGDERLVGVFADAGREADLILLAGDLTLPRRPGGGRRARRGRSGARDARLCSPRATTTGTGTAATSSRRSSSQAGMRMLDKESAVVEVGETSVGVVGRQGVRRRVPGLRSSPTSASRSLRRVYAETTARWRGSPAGWTRSRRATCGSRSSTTRRRARRSRASRPGSGRSSARTGSRSRSRSTGPTSSSTATATWAGSRARSARSRSTTSRNP